MFGDNSSNPLLNELSSGLSDTTSAGLGMAHPSGLDTHLPRLTSRSSSVGATVYFQSGDDAITVGNGNNTVFAGEGNNVISSGFGNDVIYAGSGRDIINAGDGENTIYAGEGINLITGGSRIDVIYAGSSGDFINAGDGRNTIYAGEGNNRILSGRGRDLIYAGAGNDTIYSGAGNDTIYAGEGNNVINAGTGNDTVYIGSGNDKLILEAGAGSVNVVGFNATSDKVRLGASLLGKSLNFVSQGGDTLVYSGSDLLATLKYVSSGSQALVDNGPLYRYQATDLGSLSSNPNGSVNAASINDFGQIAGRYDTGATFTNTNATTGVVNPNNLVRQGFIWEDGRMTALTSTGVKNGQSDFGAPDGATVTLLTPNVNTISNRGVILGTADEVRQPNPRATDRALLWERTGGNYSLEINDFGGVESYFFDTNNSNLIAGRNILASGYDTPIYWQDGVVTELSALGGEGGTARGINNRGQMVGFVDSDGALNDRVVNTAVIWNQDANGAYQLTNLGTFGGQQATLRDINDAGQIIGSSTSGTGTTATSTPFLLQADGTFTAIGSLGGRTGSTNGINEFGEVVGASQIASGSNHAYVWSNGVLSDLNNLVSTPLTYNGAAVTLNSAVSTNNFGQIVATGTYTYQNAAGANQTGTRSYVLDIV
jgi:probable HAF family extracellular repeat protein